MRSNSTRWLLAVPIGVLVFLAGTALAQRVEPQPQAHLDLSSEPADFLFTEPTSVLDIYRAWGKAFGVAITFDVKFKDQKIQFELHETTALESLRILNMVAGHFYVQIGERTIFLADDTPQNRRTYTPQVVQTFSLQGINLKDILTIVRSLIGTKNIAAEDARNLLILRDSVDTTRVVERLVKALDKPRGEVAIDVEVFYLADGLAEGTAAKMRGSSGGRQHGFPQRVSASQLEQLREAARTLANPTLNFLAGDKGSWSLEDSFEVTTGGDVRHLEIRLKLDVEAQIRSAERAVEMWFKLGASETLKGENADPLVSTRNTNWSGRLDPDESFLLSGFLRPGPTTLEGSPGSSFMSFFQSPAGARGEVLIAVTPRIVRGPGFTDEDLAPICIGTEVNVGLEEVCGVRGLGSQGSENDDPAGR